MPCMVGPWRSRGTSRGRDCPVVRLCRAASVGGRRSGGPAPPRIAQVNLPWHLQPAGACSPRATLLLGAAGHPLERRDFLAPAAGGTVPRKIRSRSSALPATSSSEQSQSNSVPRIVSCHQLRQDRLGCTGEAAEQAMTRVTSMHPRGRGQNARSTPDRTMHQT